MLKTTSEPESEMARCRAVRDAIDRRFKTLDALWRHMDEEEKREAQRSKRRRTRLGRAVALVAVGILACLCATAHAAGTWTPTGHGAIADCGQQDCITCERA